MYENNWTPVSASPRKRGRRNRQALIEARRALRTRIVDAERLYLDRVTDPMLISLGAEDLTLALKPTNAGDASNANAPSARAGRKKTRQ
jgi:hypothetical protein